MKTIRWNVAAVIASMLLSSAGFAQNLAEGAGSHGGDTRCQEMFGLISDISIELAKIGQANVSAINPLIDVAYARRQVMKLVVKPDHNLPREALSDPDLDETRLDIEKWEKIPSRAKKIGLAAHELMVLIRAEVDGEYGVSADVLNLIKNSPKFLDVKYEALGRYQINADGSVTSFDPRYNSIYAYLPISARSSGDGVCVSYGFSFSSSSSAERTQPCEIVVISSDGHFKEKRETKGRAGYDWGPAREKILGSLTCK